MADYEELIGIKLDEGSFGTSIDGLKKQYQSFINDLNKQEVNVKMSFAGGDGAQGFVNLLTTIKTQLGEVTKIASGTDSFLKDLFSSLEGAAGTAAGSVTSANAKITESVARSEAAQTEIVRKNVAERTSLINKQLAANGFVTSNTIKQYDFPNKPKPDNGRIKKKALTPQQTQDYQDNQDVYLQREHERQSLEQVRQERRLRESREKQAKAVAKAQADEEARVKSLTQNQQYQEYNLSGKTQAAAENAAQRQAEQQAKIQQGRDTQQYQAKQKTLSEADAIAAAERKAEEEAEKNKGIRGFARGLKKGLTPEDGTSGGSIGQFLGEIVRLQLAWTAVGAAAELAGKAAFAPIDAIKHGIDYLSQFQERSAELKVNLLDSGKFSDNPAENNARAGAAADALQRQFREQAARLNVSSDTVQTAFSLFNSYGGSKLTGPNLADSAQLAGLATAALQSQKPKIQQRVVATQLQKLASGTLSEKGTDNLPTALGISAQKLNEMAKAAQTTGDLLEKIEAASPGIVERVGKSNGTFDGLKNSIGEVLDSLDGLVAKPVFEQLSAGAQSLLKWLDDNKDSVEGVAKALGDLVGTITGQLASAAKSDIFASLVSGSAELVTNLQKVINLFGVILKANDASQSDGPLSAIYKAGQYLTSDKVNKDFAQNNKALTDKANAVSDALLSPADAEIAQRKRLAESLSSKYGNNPKPQTSGSFFFSGDQVDYNQYQKEKADGEAKIDQYKQQRFAAKLGDKAATAGYTNTAATPTGKTKDTRETISSQVSELNKQYTAAQKEIDQAEEDFRKHVDDQEKRGEITLAQSTKRKDDSFRKQAQSTISNATKYTALVNKIQGKGSANAKEDFARTTKGNVDQAQRRTGEGIDLDDTQLQENYKAISESVDKANTERLVEALDAQQQARKDALSQGDITRAQDLKAEQAYQEARYQLIRKGAENDLIRAKPGSEQQVAASQRLTTLKQQQNETQTELQRQLDENARTQIPRQGAEARISAAGRIAAGARGRVDLDQAQNVDSSQLRADQGSSLGAQSLLINEKLAGAQHELAERLKILAENASTPQEAAKNISLDQQVSKLQTDIQTLNIEQANVTNLEAKNQRDSKFSDRLADNLFGPGEGDDGKHFTSLEKSGQQVSKLTDVVGSGIQSVESGYQQSGVGGAIGSGLSSIGNVVGGPAGAVIGAVGSVTSLVSGLFTQAAQNIGKEVGKAVSKILEKYNTGQLSLNDTIGQVQQQINSLISQESGRKGGQKVLDQELPGLQDELDSLKYQQQQAKWNFQDATLESSSTNSVVSQYLTDWININKQVQDYHKAVGDAGNAQIQQFLDNQLAQQQLSLENQYNQGQQSAINDAIQLNQLLQSRNEFEDQYRAQQFQILAADSLQRVGNPAEQAARKIEQARNAYDIQVQQQNQEIAQYQQKVDYEKQIFGLANDTATLYQQSLAAQGFQLQQQLSQYQAIVALLQSTAGLTAGLTGFNIPGLTTGDGGTYVIPGTTPSGGITNLDNSLQSVTINVQVPSGTDGTTIANDIATQLQYLNRTRN